LEFKGDFKWIAVGSLGSEFTLDKAHSATIFDIDCR
jgi:hypothetical protein